MMKNRGKIFFAFGVHIGDLNAGPRRKMPEWVTLLNSIFLDHRLDAQVISSFRHTGNFAIRSSNSGALKLQHFLNLQTKTRWKILESEHVTELLQASKRFREPSPVRGFRWTRGFAFATGPRTTIENARKQWETNRGRFNPINHEIVHVWKKDLLNKSGVLERNRRTPWGAMSQDCAKELGGTWTARSKSTLLGLQTRVTESLSTYE